MFGILQEEAKRVFTLKEVEPEIAKRFGGPKGSIEGGSLAAAEKLLHKEAYSKEELEDALGLKLEDLFSGNTSQLKSVAFASKNGQHLRFVAPLRQFNRYRASFDC